MGIAFLFRAARVLFGLLGLAIVLALVWLLLRPGPQDMPWTPLRLDQPVGMFTGRKLADLASDPRTCRSLLVEAGVGIEAVPPFGEGQCRVADAVRVTPGQAMLALAPARVAPSCPVVAGLAVWTWQVVQPAAQRLLGASVARIEHLGSRSCRRIYGRVEGRWSEHATANAIDVAAFVLTDGRRISVRDDWHGAADAAAFLRRVRDGACSLFATVLSPDYNAQHQDHFHLDQANRGAMGWRACR